MSKRHIMALSLAAATVLGGAAFAASDHGHGGKPGKMNSQGMMMQGGGMMGDMSEMQGMMQRMHENMTQMMDADGDGTVTPEEMRGMMQAKLTENDADGNGSLSIEEFETLHSAMMRNMMVDRFQHLDADGDGAVTPEEMMAPAAMMERMQKMQGGSMMPDRKSDDGEKD